MTDPNPPASDAGEVAALTRCLSCRLDWRMFPPSRVDELIMIRGFKRFRPGSFVRCVECKTLCYDPIQDVPNA